MNILNAKATLAKRRDSHINILVLCIIGWWQLDVVQVNFQRIDGISVSAHSKDGDSAKSTVGGIMMGGIMMSLAPPCEPSTRTRTFYFGVKSEHWRGHHLAAAVFLSPVRAAICTFST